MNNGAPNGWACTLRGCITTGEKAKALVAASGNGSVSKAGRCILKDACRVQQLDEDGRRHCSQIVPLSSSLGVFEPPPLIILAACRLLRCWRVGLEARSDVFTSPPASFGAKLPLATSQSQPTALPGPLLQTRKTSASRPFVLSTPIDALPFAIACAVHTSLF